MSEDFDGWKRSVMYDWQDSRDVVDHLDSMKPSSEVEKLIAQAKIKTASIYLRKVADLADIATLLEELKSYSNHGEMEIVLPDINLRKKFTW